MITLTALSLHGAPVSPGLSTSFDELGGTVGRAETNQLVLPDEELTISRVHVQVVYRNGGFAVIARGANPIQHNGRALESGREATLADGDQLVIGPYLLGVQVATGASAAVPNDPFADLLAPSPAASPRSSGPVDPLSAYSARAATPAAPAASAGIPEDWDPFAHPAPAPASGFGPGSGFGQSSGFGNPLASGNRGGTGSAGALGGTPRHMGLDPGAAAPAALISDLQVGNQSGGDSLDALFGLGPGTGGDPLANSVLDNPAAKPNMAASADPMRSLMSAPRATAESRSDQSSDLQNAFVAAPQARAAQFNPAPAKAPPAPMAPLFGAPGGPAGPAGFGAPGGASFSPAPAGPRPGAAVMSWDQPSDDGATLIRPAARAPKEDLEATTVRPAFVMSQTAPQSPVGTTQARPAPVAPAPRPGAAGGSTDPALLAALLEGLAAPGVRIDALTPELMKLLGEMLRESTKGTVDLLVARAALKREVLADATSIGQRENNPLKFCPNGEAALQHLLSPTLHGFLAPDAAMREAYDDLRAHQFGMIAGMRAALEGILERFAPSELEQRLTQGSRLQTLLAVARKSRLWDLFTERYAQIRSEASDDFQSLFGSAFLKAYRDHIKQLKAGRK